MATRNVVLTEHQEQVIASLVDAGRFQNASEVLRAGLRLLEREQQVFDARLSALRDAARAGWDDIAAGNYVDIGSPADADAFWAAVDRRVDERTQGEG